MTFPFPTLGSAAGNTPATKRVIAVNFITPTATGVQTITDSRLGGATPVAAIFIYGNFQTEKSNQSIGCFYSFGVAANGNQWCNYGTDEDNVATEDCYRGGQIDEVMRRITIQGGVEASAAFSAFVANGVEIDWTVVTGIGLLSTVILFAGTEVSAECGAILGVTTAGGTVTTGFEPDAVLFSTVQLAAHTSINADFCAALGWSVDTGGTPEEEAINTVRIDASNNENTAWTGSSCCQETDGSGNIASSIDVTDYHATGFDWDSSANRTTYFYWFAIKIAGASFKATHDFAKTSIGTQALTGVGFQPDFALLATTKGPTSGSPVDTTRMGLGVWAIDKDLTHGGASFYSESSGTSHADCITSHASCVQQLLDGAIDYDFEVQSFDSDGVTFNYTDGAAAAYAVPMLLIGGLN